MGSPLGHGSNASTRTRTDHNEARFSNRILKLIVVAACSSLMFFSFTFYYSTARFLREYSITCNYRNEATEPRANINREAPVHVEEDGLKILSESLRSGNWTRLATKNKARYQAMQPFPHIAIDGAFPPSLIAALSKEMPESNLMENGCYFGASMCLQEKETQQRKSSIKREENMGHYTRMTYSIMRSQLFLDFLAELTGIPYLIPEHTPGGVSFVAPGGLLQLHADFNIIPKYKLNRRVNVFMFLNHDWDDTYGGHLEMWTRDLTQCKARVLPVAGRLVVFSTTDFSYHGHPQPLAAPPGRLRRSMAIYFYSTAPRPVEECRESDCNSKRHSTLWVRPVGCDKCDDATCAAYNDTNDIISMDKYVRF